MYYNICMQNIDWTKFIESNPDVLVGKPVIKGTRLSVDHVMGLFSQGWSQEQVLENHPSLNRDSLRAVFTYASEALKTDSFVFLNRDNNQ